MVETVIIDHDTEMEPIVLQSGWSFVVTRTGNNPEVRQLLIGNVNLHSVFHTLGLAVNTLMESAEKESGVPRSMMLSDLLDGLIAYNKDLKEMINDKSGTVQNE